MKSVILDTSARSPHQVQLSTSRCIINPALLYFQSKTLHFVALAEWHHQKCVQFIFCWGQNKATDGRQGLNDTFEKLVAKKF